MKLNWTNTTSLTLNYSGDGEKTEEDKTDYNHSSSTNYGANFSINGSLEFLGHINYSASASISEQDTKSEIMGSGPVPLVSIDSSGTYKTGYSPVSFMTSRRVQGEPVNLYARTEATQSLEAGNFHFDFDTGIEYSYNKNRGKGLITSGDVVSSANLPGSRALNFHEVPASTMLAVYHEFNTVYIQNKWMYKARLGGRYDYMNKRYNLFSPRLSTAIKYNKEFEIHAAYGISYKAPSMLTLYPGPVYYDGTNMSHFNNNPLESMAIVTTEIYEPENDHLKPSKGKTLELGLSYNHDDWSFNLTAYKKDLTNGITQTDELYIMALQQYRIVQELENQWTVTEAIDGDFVYLPFKKSNYNNNRTERTKGIEWTLTPPQIKATKTSFRLTGAYMTTKTHTETPYLHQSDVVNSTLGYQRYGLYEQSIRQYDLCTANLTLIQRIPSIRMVFTLISEFNIYTKHNYIFANRYAIGWYDNTGKYTDIPEANRYDSQYDDLTRSTQTYEQDDPPFYSNFHIQIRKELKSGHSFSFFANNFWWYNPTYKNSISLSEQTLNNKISFGFSATFKL